MIIPIILIILVLLVMCIVLAAYIQVENTQVRRYEEYYKQKANNKKQAIMDKLKVGKYSNYKRPEKTQDNNLLGYFVASDIISSDSSSSSD